MTDLKDVAKSANEKYLNDQKLKKFFRETKNEI